MTIHDKIRYEKLQYNIIKEAAKISAISSGKIDEYLTGEEILPSDLRSVIELNNKIKCDKIYLFSFRKSFQKTS